MSSAPAASSLGGVAAGRTRTASCAAPESAPAPSLSSTGTWAVPSVMGPTAGTTSE